MKLEYQNPSNHETYGETTNKPQTLRNPRMTACIQNITHLADDILGMISERRAVHQKFQAVMECVVRMADNNVHICFGAMDWEERLVDNGFDTHAIWRSHDPSDTTEYNAWTFGESDFAVDLERGHNGIIVDWDALILDSEEGECWGDFQGFWVAVSINQADPTQSRISPALLEVCPWVAIANDYSESEEEEEDQD